MTLEPHQLAPAAYPRLVALYRLGVRLQEASDDASILRALAAGLQALDLAAIVGRYEPEGDVLRLFPLEANAVGAPPGGPPIRATHVEASPVLARAVREHRSAYLADPAVELAGLLSVVAPDRVEPRTGLRAHGRAVVAPMVARGRTTGVLILVGEAIEAYEAELIREVADQLAVALDNAAVLRDLKQVLLREHAAADELRRLETLLVGLAAERDLGLVLGRIVQAAAEACASGRAALFLWDPESRAFRPTAVVGIRAELAESLCTSSAGGLGPIVAAIQGRSAIAAADVQELGEWTAASRLESHGIRSAWFVPLPDSDGEQLGAFGFFSDQPGAPTADQRALAGRYASHAAASITSHRRRQGELQAIRREVLAELARSIPHELGQPLAIIAGYAELIAEGLLEGDRLRAACREVAEAANRLGDRVQRLERISSYATKEYGPGRTVIDFDRAAGSETRPD